MLHVLKSEVFFGVGEGEPPLSKFSGSAPGPRGKHPGMTADKYII